MNDTPIKDVVKSPQDFAHVVKSAIHVAGLGEVRKACLRGRTFYVEFTADVGKFSKAGPNVLASCILSVMMCCLRYLEGFRVFDVEVVCWVGGDRHRIKTPMRILEPLIEATGGKLEGISDATVRQWVMDSVYRRTRASH